jgi:amino acid adenylation domain-containing protein
MEQSSAASLKISWGGDSLRENWKSDNFTLSICPRSGEVSGELHSRLAQADANYIFYTSGSTGKPKAILGSGQGLSHFLHWQRSRFEIGVGDRVAQLTALSFDVVLRDVFLPLTSGATLCMPNDSDAVLAPDILAWLDEEQITVLHTVPSLAQLWVGNYLLNQGTSLRWIFSAGEPLFDELCCKLQARFPSATIVNLYGPTETTLAKFYKVVGDIPHPGMQPVGSPLPQTQALVLQGECLCGVGEAGQVAIRTPFRSLGYLSPDASQADSFRANPCNNQSTDVIYLTGDRGRFAPNGELELLGRVDDQVKIRGVRIEPGEVAATILNYSRVRSCHVMPLVDQHGHKQLVAYLSCFQLNGEEPLDFDVGALIGYLSDRLPAPMVPSAYVVLDTLPLLPNGKVDRRALPAPNFDEPQIGAQKNVPPATPLQKELCAIWSEVLARDIQDITLNFFAIGGHSLLAAQVVSRLEHRCGVSLPLRTMFESPTIEKLAESIQLTASTGLVESLPPIVKRPDDRSAPLSLSQEALWFLDRLDPQSGAYTTYPTLRVRGHLDYDRLQQALDKVVDRHEVLRTTFPERDGQPVQVIASGPNSKVQLEDLQRFHTPRTRGADDGDFDPRIQAWLAAQSRHPIDLHTGPIVRLHLGRLAADDHLVVVAWHHIIHDGWSLGILAREILSTYESLSRNELPSLPALPIQYADWSVWQRELLSGKTHERLKNYWMGQLADVPSLELVTDFPRPKVRTTRGDSHRCELSPDLSRKINEFAQSSGVTPFMILLSAFGLVLARFSGQTDFAIGSPVANRRKMEVENLIGYFINMLALRVSINPETSFVDIVHHTRQVVLDAFEHQDLTLDHVVAAVNPPRDSSRHPLFQVMFVLHNNAPLSASGAGLTFEPVGNIPVRSSYFDLNLALTETEQGFAGQLVYNSDLFSPATIERMVETLSWLLESVLRDPRLPVKKFPAVLPHEEPKIRQFSLPTGNRITLASTQRCIHVEFKQRAVESPDQIALIDGTQSITYGELNRRAEDLAKTLISQSVQPGDLVAFQLSRSIEMIVTMLGILKAGAGYLPLDVKSPLGRNLDTLQDAAPRCIVTESLYADSFQSTGLAVLLTGHPSAELFVADNQAPSMLSAPRSVLNDNPRRSAVDAGNPAYVIYTSGSTGKPKGVVISHAAVMGYVLAAQQAYDITAADRLLQFTSISFDAHVEEVWVSLLSGATLVLRDDTMINSIAEFISASERYALTVWSLPTGFWHEVVNECDRSGLSLPGKLRIVVIGGETAIPDRLEAWHNLESPPRLLNSYGPTEATVVATVAELEWQESQSERLPIGRPLPNTMAYVLDEFRQLQPIGVRGELYLGGLSLADGYLHNAQLTTERFISLPMIRRDLLTGMDDRLYRTGDIVRWREDGQLEFFGRRDHQVKIRGFRVELSEIEGILRQHPLIDDALVVAEELRAGEIQLAAYLVGLTDELPTASVLRAYASQYLPEHMLPLQFQAISQIPRTVSGKVDRKSLPAIDWSGSSTPDNFVAPADEIELAIAVRFAEVLNREQVGVNDDFFALGGNSLLSLRLASRLREDFGLDVPLAVLFTSPTVRQLASRYRELPSSPPASEARSDRRDPECNASPIAVSDYLVELKAGNSGFPLFMIHGLGGHIVNFIPLARTLNTARPIWALQGLGIDGRFEPHADMGQMADLYCRALRQKQSHGPYRLLGWSMGGLLAMEIGRRLIEQGEAVEPLLLLDTHLSLKDRSLQAVTEESVLRQIAPRLGIPLRALRRLPIEAQWDTILRTSQELIRSPQGDNGEEEIRRLATVCKAHLQAMAENKLNYFPGQIILLQAARPWRRIDPRWRSLCDAFTSQTVAGSHYSMMAPPDVAQLAAAIDHALSAGSQ